MKVNNNEIEVKEEFVQQLIEMSRDKTPEEIVPNNKNESLRNKPVVLTGANNRFFIPLLKSIRTIQKHLTDYTLIVYDLGIKEHNLQTVSCQLFNDLLYRYISSVFCIIFFGNIVIIWATIF